MARKRSSSQIHARRKPRAKNELAASGQSTAIEIHTSDDEADDLEMEDIEPPKHFTDAEDDLELEEVNVSRGQDSEEHTNEYATVHQVQQSPATEDQASDAEQVVLHNGKRQPRAVSGISLVFGESYDRSSSSKTGTAKSQRINVITPKDRAARLEGHKLHVLALIAHCKVRNQWINEENLRNHLYNMSPATLRHKLRSIHPKKITSQRERVRMFEALMNDLVRWWAVRFYLDPDQSSAGAIRQPNTDMLSGAFPRPGRRVDGWIMETERDRTRRHTREQKSKKSSKSNEKERSVDKPSTAAVTNEITIFPLRSDSASRPAYLRLLPAPEPISSPADLLRAAETRSGSRETSAQLFCGLCRALGIPSRLVISPQVAAWNVGASKVAQSASAVDVEEWKAVKDRGRKDAGESSKLPRRQTRRSADENTSDDEEFVDGLVLRRQDNISPLTSLLGACLDECKGQAIKNGNRSRPMSLESESTSPIEDLNKLLRPTRGPEKCADGKAFDRAGDIITASRSASQKFSGKSRAEKDDDYRDEKWKGLDAPLEVEHQPKLRPSKPAPAKETELESQIHEDVEPLDLTSPPVMWVEVFSKPFQRWITIDPVRARVTATGNRQMEPSTSDRANRLVYVVAFEEDGYARDVTARYTKTLYSRVSRMRPPATRKDGDWWEQVVRALQRPQRLERDAVEDAELREVVSKEPMPNSVSGFKDHPVYALERHLKRDETIHPYFQVGTFQGIPVFHRKNVISLRSARQWYNEGREVEAGQEALKWVKTRGYTINSLRAEERARAEGAEEPQEGLYARFQTKIYTPPPVKDGIVPKNHFGNIDLFVPSMLPAGAAHIPYNGAAKVAKKLGVNFADAITGFGFRKHRSIPRLTGIVVPEQYKKGVLDAYWALEHAAAEKEIDRQQERALRHWRKLLNALRIAKRMKEQYGKETEASNGIQDNADGGGFFIEDEHSALEGVPDPQLCRPRSLTPQDVKFRMSSMLEKCGSAPEGPDQRRNPADSEGPEEEDETRSRMADADANVAQSSQSQAGIQQAVNPFSEGTKFGSLEIIPLSDLAKQWNEDNSRDAKTWSPAPNGNQQSRLGLTRNSKEQKSAKAATPPAPSTGAGKKRKSPISATAVEKSVKTSQPTRRSIRRATPSRKAIVKASESSGYKDSD